MAALHRATTHSAIRGATRCDPSSRYETAPAVVCRRGRRAHRDDGRSLEERITAEQFLS